MVTVFAAQATPTRMTARSMRAIAVTRAAAAGLWALVFLVALHGRVLPTGADIPPLEGLLLAAYPLIDAAASLFEPRGPGRSRPRAAVVTDGLALVAVRVRRARRIDHREGRHDI